MINFKKVVELSYIQRKSTREIAAIMHCSKSTINDFIHRFDAYDRTLLPYPIPKDITNEQIHELLYQQQGLSKQESMYREPNYEQVFKALKLKGQTLKRQWRIYDAEGVVDGKQPYSYRQFCYKIQQWCDKKEHVNHIIREPGENIELDFAGMTLDIKPRYPSDPVTPVTIFIATLSYSSYFYAEGITCADEANWIRVCNNAIYYFNGISPLVTCDNCKVAVNKNKDWIEPDLNQTFQSWADYYGTAIVPAAVRSPRWKPNVENTVGIVTRDILVDMKEMTFISLSELNDELFRRVNLRNRENLTGQDYSRYDLFEREEKGTLLPLPNTPFELMEREMTKVRKDLSVFFDRNHYSMVKKYYDKKVEVRATSSTVFIYKAGTDVLLKQYPRCYGVRQWIYDDETKPRTDSDYSSWSPTMFLQMAARIGKYTTKLIDKVLASKDIPNQSFRACWGILSFAKKYGNDALEECAHHALDIGRPNYTYVKNSISRFCKTSVSEPELVEDSSFEMKYKVPDSRYSLKHLQARQEDNNEQHY